MIRKESSDGIGYSVVELNDVRHVFASASPRQGEDLHEQAADALNTIESVIQEEGTRGSIVKQAVFLKNLEQRKICHQIMKDFYGDELPATSYIQQPPCEGKLLTIEALGVGRGQGEVEIERFSERMVVTRHDGIDWVHLANIFPETSATSVYDRSMDILQLSAKGLNARGFRYNQIIRTWLYLGDIVGPESTVGGETQRYKELNRARTDFYGDLTFGDNRTPPGVDRAIYPASTGIGTEGKDVMMSAIAMVTDRDDITLLPLENPQQTSAFDYGQEYSPESPKFARAMAITNGDIASTFVSGTASITESETRFIGDVEGQTRQTLENIAELIGEDNFRQHGAAGLGATLDDLALVRVYIKNQEDYAKTRAVCEGRLGELPIVYAVADICRPELLVEIEGIAFSGQVG